MNVDESEFSVCVKDRVNAVVGLCSGFGEGFDFRFECDSFEVSARKIFGHRTSH